LAPLIQMFPVGLGLKLVISSTVLSVLLFGLLLPVLGQFKNKRLYAILSLSLCALFFISAHLHSSPSPERPHPTSLVYQLNLDTHRSEEHTSELQSRFDVVCRLLLEKK